MKNKGLLIGLASVLGIAAVGLGLYFGLKPKKTEETESENNVEPDKLPMPSGSSTTTTPSSPFATKEQGDAFRRWMKVNHPDYRFKGDVLDESGSHTNSFIRDAYSKYGAEYEASKVAPTPTPTTGSTFGNATSVSIDDLRKLAQRIADNTGNIFDTMNKYLGADFVQYEFEVNANKFRIVFYKNGRFIMYKLLSNGVKEVNRGNYRDLGNIFEITEGFGKGQKIVGTQSNLLSTIKSLVTGFSGANGLSVVDVKNVDPFFDPKMSNYSSPFEF